MLRLFTTSSAKNYWISTSAPASVSFAFISSASAFATPSLMGLGAPSTSSLASFNPRPVRSFTIFTTLSLLGPAAFNTTLKAVFSTAAGAAAAAPPPPDGAATAAAGSMPYSSFRIFASSFTSFTVRFTNCSANDFKSAIVVNFYRLHCLWLRRMFKKMDPCIFPGSGIINQ